PNNEILTGTVVNYTRDFPYVWDELTVAIASESDLPYAMEVLNGVADRELDGHMAEAARLYEALLPREGREVSVADRPRLYAGLTDWGVNLTIRYLVAVKEKRGWKSRLSVAVTRELNREEHAGRIVTVYPRQQIQLVGPDGAPAEPRESTG